MKTRREFIKQVAMGAGLLALAPHGVASSNPKYHKEFYKDFEKNSEIPICDRYTKEAEGAFGCLKNWFDCTEEELVVRVLTIVREGLVDRSNGAFNPEEDEFILEIPHWNILRQAKDIYIGKTFEQDVRICYPNCIIKQSIDESARAKWMNLESYIAYLG